ncbi:DNA helicase, partial [Myxococcota bacterium]|nr:DNA helicase [Myxococcota bacterium]
MPRLHIAKSVLQATINLPRGINKKLVAFVSKFGEDSSMASIHFEKIENARSPYVRSVRIDLSYRGIVLQPPKGEDFVLVWVDHHDEAYQWAMNKVFEVNDVTGVMQVYDTVEVERVVERIDLKDDDSSSARTTNQTLPPEDSAPAWANGDGLFGECSDEDLCRLGVPRILLPSLRAITDQQTLEQLKPLLPEEVQEGLTYLSVGLSVDEVLVYLQSAPPLVNEVDTTDWRRALAHPQSRRSFSPIASTEEFEQILSGPLDAWRVFLHPSQDAIIRRSYSGPAKVLGGAGTGKTVVAM